MVELKELVSRIFNVAYLVKDPCVVFAMDNDLWVPVRFLMNLEEFRIMKVGFEDIVRAALDLGFEINSQLGLIRKKFSLPRTQVVVEGFSNLNEMKLALENFDFISIQEVEGKEQFTLNCFCEEHAIEMALFLRNLGKSAVIEAVDTYLMLVSRVIQYVKEFTVIPFFFEPIRKQYTLEEVKEAYRSHVPCLMKEMEKSKAPVILKDPVKFLIFNE